MSIILDAKIGLEDTVYWVHCSNRVYKGTVKGASICEYQGAVYLNIFSPSFRINQWPTVHYSHVFKYRGEAEEFAAYVKREGLLAMRCDRCRFEYPPANNGKYEEPTTESRKKIDIPHQNL